MIKSQVQMPNLSIARANTVYHRLIKWCTEGKVSVTPKSLLVLNNRKTYYNTFAVSAVPAYGQPSQEAPKNIRDQPTDGEFYVLSGILILTESVPFSYLVNSMQNQARSTSWASAIDLLATPDVLYFLNAFSFQFCKESYISMLVSVVCLPF